MNDTLSTAHDQPVLLTESELDIINSVDKVIERTVAKGDPRIALEFVRDMRRSGIISGLAMAKTLYELRVRWDSFPTDDDFVDVAMAETGLGVGTIRKYLTIWEGIFVNPDVEQRVKDSLMGVPVGTLYLLAPAAKEGQLTPDDWERAAKAPDRQSVREIVQSRRGVVGPASNTMVIMLDRDGTMKARVGKSHYVTFGYLNLKIEDEVAKKAIDRIINYAHVIQR